MVKTLNFGQSAETKSKFVIIEYDLSSTTARVLVSYDSLISLNLLKIQSSLIWKYELQRDVESNDTIEAVKAKIQDKLLVQKSIPS
jgi:hypothetical protein